jgi:hypothetical protein
MRALALVQACLAAACCTALLAGGCAVLFPLDDLTSSKAPADAQPTDSQADGAASSAYRNAVMADSPLFYLRLNEAMGPDAVDEMRHYNGTYSGGGITYGVPGAIATDPGNKAIQLAGGTSGSGIAMPAGTDLDFVGSVAFTLEVWVNQSSAMMGYAFVLDHEDFSTTRHGWDLLLEPGMMPTASDLSAESWNQGSIQSVVYAPAAVPMGAFHYVVMTFDGTTQRLYVDAKLAATPNVVMTMTAAVAIPWRIGKQNCDPCAQSGVDGVLDEIAVYPRALDDQQITRHYQAATQP